jgi:hypothetical protein
MIRFLIDTNICIHREDDKIIPDALSEFMRLANELNLQMVIHPLSLTELNRDQDAHRRETILSKLGSYAVLSNPPDPIADIDYLSRISGDRGKSVSNDAIILYSLARNAADFFITEDGGIHKIAKRVGIGDRVLFIEEARNLLRDLSRKRRPFAPLALIERPMYTLNLSEPFFDYFKEKYPDFENWWAEKSKQGRKAFVHFNDVSGIGALFMLKEENETIDSNPPIPKRPRVKICLMRSSAPGNRLGELFIRMAVDLAMKNSTEEIYLTHFTEPEDRLVEMLNEFGFRRSARNAKYGDDIYLKRLIFKGSAGERPSPLDLDREFYPSYYDGPAVDKFIVPIQPRFHQRLFIDWKKRQTTLEESSGIPVPEGNAISKAYLCHAKIRSIKPGSVLLFYRSGDMKSITTIGIVESLKMNVLNESEALAIVSRRTVYSMSEIRNMLAKPTMVLRFRYQFHLPKPIGLIELRKMGVLKGAPQSILEIDDAGYCQIVRMGGLDERYRIRGSAIS